MSAMIGKGKEKGRMEMFQCLEILKTLIADYNQTSVEEPLTTRVFSSPISPPTYPLSLSYYNMLYNVLKYENIVSDQHGSSYMGYLGNVRDVGWEGVHVKAGVRIGR